MPSRCSKEIVLDAPSGSSAGISTMVPSESVSVAASTFCAGSGLSQRVRVLSDCGLENVQRTVRWPSAGVHTPASKRVSRTSVVSKSLKSVSTDASPDAASMRSP